MTDLAKDLAALRIPREERGGGQGKPVLWVVIVVGILALAGAGYYWSTRLQAASVKVVAATEKASGAPAAGAVLNASGYVTARRRATVSSKVTGKVMDVLIEEGHPVKEG